MEEDSSGHLVLKKEHAYYSQVQLQIKLNDADYCDFVVWREDGIMVQRIFLNHDCISAALNGIPSFVKCCILPELIGKYFTKSPDFPSDLGGASNAIADTQPSAADDSHATNDCITPDDASGDLPDSSNSTVVGNDVTDEVPGYSCYSLLAGDNQEELDCVRDDVSMRSSQNNDLNMSQDGL